MITESSNTSETLTIRTAVFGSRWKMDIKFTWAVFCAVDQYCSLTSKVTLFWLHSLLYFSTIREHHCNFTYWCLFCLFFPRIPNINSGSLTALCVSNIFFMLPWQFAQFVLLTQVRPCSPLHSLFVLTRQTTALRSQPLNSRLYWCFCFSQIALLLPGKIHTFYHNIFLVLYLKVDHLHHSVFCFQD